MLKLNKKLRKRDMKCDDVVTHHIYWCQKNTYKEVSSKFCRTYKKNNYEAFETYAREWIKMKKLVKSVHG